MTKRKAAVFLWFDTEAEAAAEFYAATFPDSHVDNVIRVPEGATSAPAGTVQVVEMTLLGLPYALLNAGPTPIRCRSIPRIRPRRTGSGMPSWRMAESPSCAAGARIAGAIAGRLLRES